MRRRERTGVPRRKVNVRAMNAAYVWSVRLLKEEKVGE
jgi:hypothetical protein